MRLVKSSDGHYVLIKLNPSDWKFLTNLNRREGRKFIKEVDRQFKEIVSMQIQTLSVIQIGDMLRRKKVIGDANIDRLLKDLDDSMRNHHNLIQKYYEKFGNIYEKKIRLKKKK